MIARPPNSYAIDCTAGRPYAPERAVAELARLTQMHGPAVYHLFVNHDFDWPKWKASPPCCPNCGSLLEDE